MKNLTKFSNFFRSILILVSSRYTFFLLITFTFLFIFKELQEIYNNQEVIFSHALELFLIFLLLLYFFIKSTDFASQIMSTFLLFFFGIAPIIQYSGKHFSQLPETLIKQTYAETNIVLLLYLIFFIGSFFYFKKNQKKFPFLKKINFKVIKNKNKSIFFSIFICSAIYLIVLKGYNWNLYHTFIYVDIENKVGYLFSSWNSRAIFTLVNFFLKLVLANFFVLFFIMTKNKIFKLLYFIILLVVFPPIANQRFLVLLVYMPIIIHLINYIFFSLNVHKKYIYNNLFLIAFPSMFLLLNIFRSQIFKFETNLYNFLKTGNFDAYEMVMSAINYKLILNIPINFYEKFSYYFLFFIPRSIWPDKGNSLALEISTFYNMTLKNVSLPIFAEFFYYFSYYGLIILGIFSGWLLSSLEKLNLNKKTSIILKIMIIQIVIVFCFFQRGPIGPMISILIGNLLGWLIITILWYNQSKITKFNHL